VADPARQRVHVQLLGANDGRNLHALLPCEPDLATHHRPLKHRRRDNEHEVLDRGCSYRLLDLRPPVPPALHGDEILPERKAGTFEPGNTVKVGRRFWCRMRIDSGQLDPAKRHP
jgi:hypothetical protein